MTTLFVLAGAHPPAYVVALEPKFIDQIRCGWRLRRALKRAVAYEVEARDIGFKELREAISRRLA